MGRVKTKLELISSDKKRKSSFDMRSKSIMKKASELSTLCGVNVGLIISSGAEIYIQTWSKNNEKEDDRMLLLDDMIRSYISQDLIQKKKRTTNATHFLGGGILNKTDDDSKSYNGMSRQELGDLATCLDSKVQKVKDRIEFLRQANPINQLPYLVDDDDDDDEVNQVISSNQAQLCDIDIDDDDDPVDLAYLLDEILENPVTPKTATTDSHDGYLGIPWSHGLPLPVNPKPTTASSSSTDHHYPPMINMESRDQLLITDQLPMTQFPNEFELFNYYINQPEPDYFDFPVRYLSTTYPCLEP